MNFYNNVLYFTLINTAFHCNTNSVFIKFKLYKIMYRKKYINYRTNGLKTFKCDHKLKNIYKLR